MSNTAETAARTLVPGNLLSLTEGAATSAETLFAKAKAAVTLKVSQDGKISAALIEREQFAAHGLS